VLLGISVAALRRVTGGERVRACVGVQPVGSRSAPELQVCGSLCPERGGELDVGRAS
jgi:hypothetical protein